MAEDNRQIYIICNQIKSDIRSQARQTRKFKKDQIGGDSKTPSPNKKDNPERERTPGQLLFATVFKKKDRTQRRDAADFTTQFKEDQLKTTGEASLQNKIPTVPRNPEGKRQQKQGESKFNF